jgi:hypothetical protein
MSNNAESKMPQNDEQQRSRKLGSVQAYLGESNFRLEEQLLKSLKTQQNLMRKAIAVPDLAASINLPSLKAFQNIQRELAYQDKLQKLVSSEIAKSSLLFRSVQDRILVETKAMAGIANATKSFSESMKRAAILPQIASGQVLSNMRSILRSQMLAESALRPFHQAIADLRYNVNNSFFSSIRTAVAAQSAIVKQLESVRQSHLAHQKLIGGIANAKLRIEAIGLNKLSVLIDEIAADKELVAVWTEESINSAATQFESELEALPDFRNWDIEKQLSYLIDWTVKHDNAETKRNFVALIINILSSILFAILLQPIIDFYSESEGSTQIVVNHVRQQIRILMLDSFEAADLHIVCKRSVPLLKSNNRRSQKVATLQAGCVVRKIEKIGKWIHVEWTNPGSGTTMRGWMLSKYLARVDRKASRYRALPISIHVQQESTLADMDVTDR